ncbi:Nucleoporin SEH1 [Neolecta irregularis DAH-3]|uniref:Nucleoporin SEH1 n=1 Tax=Neolecta irregularis (strain DAH-3) TaxID=1198029 RepID=A0A1U7LHQ1_NEOID|nr:Nucleoporin SEH1 [Neolecta irregularis DAH-3]|eukprot:OLL22158.1 Nucleoporin SEH1 [Neolecta irregularis DAH-3]
MEFHPLKTGHQDLIHDISYGTSRPHSADPDFYGKRLATCSSDFKIKVWDLNPHTNQWLQNDSWKAHDSAVLKVRWAHPEHGQLIASCSMDRSILISEEQESEQKCSGKRWREKRRITESRAVVYDISFAPVHLGLKLVSLAPSHTNLSASVSADGIVRILECLEPFNPTNWTVMDEFSVSSPTQQRIREAESSFCVDWCLDRWAPAQLVVAAQNTLKIYKVGALEKFTPTHTIDAHAGLIRDVAWAPRMGRSYPLIATACKDGRVRIFKIHVQDEEEVETVGDFDDHNGQVWKVNWNVTGSILSSVGDDGMVKLWKATYLNQWKCMSTLAC